jgi:hypothetical protein
MNCYEEDWGRKGFTGGAGSLFIFPGIDSLTYAVRLEPEVFLRALMKTSNCGEPKWHGIFRIYKRELVHGSTAVKLENSSTIKNICVFLYTFDNSSACIM